MRNKYLQFGLGMIVGGLLFSTTAAAADYLTATVSTQRFYLNGQPVQFEAYAIHGNNFVKLRDIGQAVDFGVTYDGTTNSVYIDPNSHYEQEVQQPAQTATAPSELTEENVRATIRALRDIYPTGTYYPAPYVPNNAFDRPYSNCDACAGWAMLCSDTAFGDLPWQRVMNPRWEDIRAGDLLDWRYGSTGHVVVVLEKTEEYVKVTESGSNNMARWGGQYFRWWLEEQTDYSLRTRYPQ
ncbi:MAG: copper amine oxidase N-terminal domain-containing protein [Oscillospiraceae bacterium]